MKQYSFLLVLALFVSIYTQAQKGTYLRIYDNTGKKFQTGFLAGTTDSSILILKDFKDSSKLEIPVSKINLIKTRRGIGQSFLLGALSGAVVFGAIGAATGEEKVNDGTFGGAIHDAFTYDSGEGFTAGAIVGGIGGASIGGLIGSLHKRISFKLHGSQENWRQQKSIMEQLLFRER